MQQACYEQRLADVTAFNRSEQCARAELCNSVQSKRNVLYKLRLVSSPEQAFSVYIFLSIFS